MSIEAQLAELAEYAKREGLEVIEQFVESKSAKKPGREIFNSMIEKIHASKNPVGILAGTLTACRETALMADKSFTS